MRPPVRTLQPMNDGPLIVQSDKTLLLEVDHERAGDCRKAIAPFAELERSPEHVHTYRLTPLGLWNARAAGHDAEQVVDALLQLQPLRRAARAARRRRRDDGPLRPAAAGEAPGPRPGAGRAPTGRCSRRCCAPRRSPACSATRHRRRHRRRAPVRARQPQAGAAQAGLAGRGLRRLRRRRGAPDRRSTRTAGRCAPTSARPPSASGTAAPASSCCPAAPARRSSARPRWRRPRRPR